MSEPYTTIAVFSTTKRGGKTALWVSACGKKLNIWDLDENELTDDVLAAIRSAVSRGIELHKESCRYTPEIYIGPLQEPWDAEEERANV